ncbi:hypothetical protein BAE44_0024218 [Dichanthelium oligosanthes]|uniref:Uncharacterized protein n=1 Tax=Dichanthelium oligosanthes TaxID=888268 RepID=A0A1E5UPH5_9POAL|nr:hypothetical protein BAE44_0024218 [Dichanthelium oligosanthes]
MATATAAVVVGVERDPALVSAAQILVSLRSRKLKAPPEWGAPTRAAGEAAQASSSASPATAPALDLELELREGGWGKRRRRSGGRRRSLVPCMKALQEMRLAALASASGGEERGDEAPARSPVEAAAGSGLPSTSSADRGAARTQPRPQRHAADEKAAAQPQEAKGLGAAPAAKEPMKASSPDTPLDYGGGSRASSSADDAARPKVKRKGPGARGSGGGAASSADDDEGCSSPAKRARVASSVLDTADEEKPIPTEEQSMQIETAASSGKGILFDLNFPPPIDDGACPDAC